jgi:hypothetical protein
MNSAMSSCARKLSPLTTKNLLAKSRHGGILSRPEISDQKMKR